MFENKLGERVLTASLASIMFLGSTLPALQPVYASQVSGPKKNTVEHLIVLGDCERDADGNPKYSLVADMYNAVKAEYSSDRKDYDTDNVSTADNTNDADGIDDTNQKLNVWFYADNDGNGIPDWYDQAAVQSDHGDNDGSSSTNGSYVGINAYVKQKLTARYRQQWTNASEYKEQRTQNALNKAIDRYQAILSDISALNVSESTKLNYIHNLQVNWQNVQDEGQLNTNADKTLTDILQRHPVPSSYDDYGAKASNAETLFSDFTMPKDKKGNAITGDDMVLKQLKAYDAAAGDNDHDGEPDTKTAIVIYYGLDDINDLTGVRHDADTNTGKYHKWKYHPAYFEHDHDMECQGHDEETYQKPDENTKWTAWKADGEGYEVREKDGTWKKNDKYGSGTEDSGRTGQTREVTYQVPVETRHETTTTSADENYDPDHPEKTKASSETTTQNIQGGNGTVTETVSNDGKGTITTTRVTITGRSEPRTKTVKVWYHDSTRDNAKICDHHKEVDCKHYHEAYWDCIPIFQHQSNIVDHKSAPERYNEDLSAATQKWQDEGALIYWVGMLPGYGYASADYAAKDDNYGYWQEKFNNMLQSNLPAGVSYLDVNDAVLDKVPYFEKTASDYKYGYTPDPAWSGDGDPNWNWKNQMYSGYNVTIDDKGNASATVTGEKLNMVTQKLDGTTTESSEKASKAWLLEEGESADDAESNAASTGKSNPYNKWGGGKTAKDDSYAARSPVYVPPAANADDYDCYGCNWAEGDSGGDAMASHEHRNGGAYTDSAGNKHKGGQWDQEAIKGVLDPNPTMSRSKTDGESTDADGVREKKYSSDGYVFTRKVVKSDHTIVDESKLTGGKDVYHSADNGSQGMGYNDFTNVDLGNGKSLHEIMTSRASNWVSKDKDDMEVNFSSNSAKYQDEDYKYEYNPSKDQLKHEHEMTLNWKYDEKTLQYVYHIILNSIYVKNDRAKTADAIDTSFYSISCSLTTWINNILSGNGSSSGSSGSGGTGAADASVNLGTTGNAGAVLGYGDKDFSFSPYLAEASSKTSTGVSYKALEKNGKDTAKELAYARYGHLLSDLGLDQYGMKTSVSGGRLIPGGLLTFLFTCSLFAGKALNFMIRALQFINPFQFLTKIDGGEWAGNLTGTKDFLTGHAGDNRQMPAGISNPLTAPLSYLYDVLSSISWAVVVPLMFAVTIFLVLVWNRSGDAQAKHRGESSQLIKTTLFRVIFIAVGVPLLGALYTSVLSAMSTVTADVHSPAAETVVSSFVDFGSWAKNNRLDPAGTLVYNNDSESSDTASVRDLRQTAYQINRKSGAVRNNISSVFQNGTGNSKWTENNLKMTGDANALNQDTINDAYRLLSDYTQDNFYYPSDWESDVMGVLQNTGIDAGRRQGAVEDGNSFKQDADQGEKTVYNMFSETSTADKWTGRSSNDNSAIFASGSSKWKNFNIFNNGNEIASVKDGSTKYKSTSLTKNGTSISVKTGLSTMSMYNYLSSRFADDGVVTYSNRQAASLQSRLSHHAVNLLGGGTFRVLYFLNTMAMLLITAIIGIGYALGTIVNAFKRGIKVMASVPGAALGVMQSIVTIITTVVIMIAEVIGTVFTYIVMTQLLLVLGEVLSGAAGEVANETTTAMVGGRFADIAAMLSRSAGISMTAAYGCTLAAAAGMLLMLSAVLLKYRRAYLLGAEFMMAKTEKAVLPQTVCDIMKEQEEAPVQKPAVPVPGVLDYLSGRVGTADAV